MARQLHFITGSFTDHGKPGIDALCTLCERALTRINSPVAKKILSSNAYPWIQSEHERMENTPFYGLEKESSLNRPTLSLGYSNSSKVSPLF